MTAEITMSYRRHVEVIKNNKDIMVQNLVLTDEMLDKCKESKVLTVTMVREIKLQTELEAKNLELVVALSKLGPDAFHKFCNILHLTGHRLLADHLREEESMLEEGAEFRMNFGEIAKKFPSLEKNLTQLDQKLLLQYVRDKVTENSIRLVWKKHTAARTRAAQERQELLDESATMERRLNDRSQQIQELEEDVKLRDVVIAEKDNQIKSMSRELYETNKRHQEAMDVVVAGQAGAERSAQSTQNRIGAFDQSIKSMNVRCAIFLGTPEMAAKFDASNVQVSKLEANMQEILDRCMQYERTMEENERSIKKLTKEVNKLTQVNKDNKAAMEGVNFLRAENIKLEMKLEQDKWKIMSDIEGIAEDLQIPNDNTVVVKGGLASMDKLSDEEKQKLLEENVIDVNAIKKRIQAIRGQIGRNKKEYDVKAGLLSAYEGENEALKSKIEFLQSQKKVGGGAVKTPKSIADSKSKPAINPMPESPVLNKTKVLPPVSGSPVNPPIDVTAPAKDDAVAEQTKPTGLVAHHQVPSLKHQEPVAKATLTTPIPTPRGSSNLGLPALKREATENDQSKAVGNKESLGKPSVSFREVTLLHQ